MLFRVSRPFMVIAHRGASGVRPENTLAAFREAIALGIDHLECDVRLSRDAHVVVIHDATVDRTTNGRGRVADHTLAELRALDAGEASASRCWRSCSRSCPTTAGSSWRSRKTTGSRA